MKLSDFIGIPFVNGGRDFKGCDCWGLVMLYYRCLLNQELPDYRINASDFARISDVMRGETGKASPVWDTRLDSPETNDIALMRLGASKDINHAGIILHGNKMLHCYEKAGSCIVDLTSERWKRLVRIYIRPSKVNKP